MKISMEHCYKERCKHYKECGGSSWRCISQYKIEQEIYAEEDQKIFKCLKETKIMKTDLHIHMKKTSHCAKMDTQTTALELDKNQIYGACAFDHNYYTTDQDIKEIISIATKTTVFRGTEINIKGPKGNIEDFILISPATPKFELKKINILELVNFINKNDALTILAHPYRRRDFVDFNWDWFAPDAVEIWSTHIKVENRDKITELHKKYGMAPIVTSDAHKIGQIGQYYIDIPDGIKTEEELKWIIKTRRYCLPI